MCRSSIGAERFVVLSPQKFVDAAVCVILSQMAVDQGTLSKAAQWASSYTVKAIQEDAHKFVHSGFVRRQFLDSVVFSHARSLPGQQAEQTALQGAWQRLPDQRRPSLPERRRHGSIL